MWTLGGYLQINECCPHLEGIYKVVSTQIYTLFDVSTGLEMQEMCETIRRTCPHVTGKFPLRSDWFSSNHRGCPKKIYFMR